MADWYYIGNYGQLGPLTREQMDELIEGGVILRETYVWRTGMPSWVPADTVAELQEAFRLAEPYASPPPPPAPGSFAPPQPTGPYGASPGFSMGSAAPMPGYGVSYHPVAYRSDKSRVLAGLLNLIPPGGIGRLYLGYSAHGVLQLMLGLFTCVGYIWSVIDAIVLLSGGVKYDGYGRTLNE